MSLSDRCRLASHLPRRPGSSRLSSRVRLDQLLVERGLAPSRAQAQALLLGGKVRVGSGDGARLDRKPGDQVAARGRAVAARNGAVRVAGRGEACRRSRRVRRRRRRSGLPRRGGVDRWVHRLPPETRREPRLCSRRGTRSAGGRAAGRRARRLDGTHARGAARSGRPRQPHAPGARLPGRCRRVVHLADAPPPRDGRRHAASCRADPHGQAAVRAVAKGGPQGRRARRGRSGTGRRASTRSRASRSGWSPSAWSSRRSSGRPATTSSSSTFAYPPGGSREPDRICLQPHHAAGEGAAAARARLVRGAWRRCLGVGGGGPRSAAGPARHDRRAAGAGW